MICFTISAPGKIILFGEHAVVYGKTAVAASLNRRTTVTFHQSTSENAFIRIQMPKLKLLKSIPIDQVLRTFFNSEFPRLSVVGHEIFYQHIQEFFKKVDFDDPRQRTSCECLFYALVQVAQEEELKLEAFNLELDTELLIGTGLGSSASFSVCLVATFLHWARLQKNTDVVSGFDDKSLHKISQYALNCERIMHGSPSGIDNSICTFGSIVEFRKNEVPNFISLKSRSLKVILVDTRIARSTKLLVENVARLMIKYPEIFHKIMEAIDQVSKQAIDVIKEMQTLADNENDKLRTAYEELATLITTNQGLLASCHVSHTSLDLICVTSKKFGFSCKLTGAGGGGFAYILIPPDTCSDKLKNLCLELTLNGFSVIETNLGGSGVVIHDQNITDQ